MKTLSVIVPIFNAETTIVRCVESILAASSQGIEIILVDDGSTDGSALICDNIAEGNPNITVLHIENGGPSKARNVGIEIASGDYIAFVDSDDEIPSAFYDKCIGILSVVPVDLFCFGFAYVSQSGDINPQIKKSIPSGEVLDRSFIERKIIPPLINIENSVEFFVDNYLWNKIFSRDIIKSNEIYLDSTRKMWEDRPFITEFCKYAQTFYYLPEVGYYYINTSNSLSHKFNPDSIQIVFDNFRNNECLFGETYDLYCPYAVQYYCRAFLNNAQELCKYPEHSNQVIEMINDVVNDELTQRLFRDFEPKCATEVQMVEKIRSHDATQLYSLLKSNLYNEERRKRLGNYLIMRIMRRLQRIFWR